MEQRHDRAPRGYTGTDFLLTPKHNRRRIERCPKWDGSVSRLISAPKLNRYSYSSPTEAKYAKVYPEHEIAKEKVLQKVYQRVWLPPPVVHSPCD
jgi:hypothetical protein